MSSARCLLSIVEIGGYPNFAELYRSRGFTIEIADSMRKAVKLLKKIQPAVIVAEFNFQSDFRDRTSSLETLMATVQKWPETKVIIFYEKEQRDKLERVLALFNVFAILAFPIQEAELAGVLDRALQEAA